MAEDYEMPGLEKAETIRRKVLKGADEVHDRFARLNRAAGAEWVQPDKEKGGPSMWRKAYDYLKRRIEMYGEPKSHFEPEYSEAEKKEREELRAEFEGFEKYNPKDLKGKKKIMETLVGTSYGKEKMKTHFKPEYSTEEEMEKKKWKWRFERFEPYKPEDSKEYGAKDRLMDIGAAIAKVKLGQMDTEDKPENYVEFEEALKKPVPMESTNYKTALSAGTAKYVKKLHGKA